METAVLVDSAYALIDPSGQSLGRVDVVKAAEGVYEGVLSEDHLPERVRELLARHERLVNDGLLGLLDEVERDIEGLGLRLRSLATARMYRVSDFQLMNGREVSFKVAGVDGAAA